MLDGSSISSLNDVYYSYNIVSQEYAMTTTSAVTTGTPTLALLFVGLLNPNYTNLVIRVKGSGMSVMVLY